ncbi:MAG: ROK family protein [Peptidiphaga sp.]
MNSFTSAVNTPANTDNGAANAVVAPASCDDETDRRIPDSNAGAVFALDIGGTWIRAARLSPRGALEARSRRPMPKGQEGRGIIDACLQALGEVGAVDPATGRLFTPPNTDSNLAGLDLGADLARSTGLDVRVDRDTNVAALGEHAFGAARGVANFVYMTVSTGVGGAVMLDGRLLRGVDGVAGEIGHISVDRVGPSCGCGRRGCLEAIASGPAIARRAGDLAEEGGPLHEILASGRALTGKDVDECAAAGDIAARLVLESAARAVASACVDMANAFNPELIVIGGGVAIAHPQWISRACECVAREALVPANRAGIVVPAQLGDDVSLVGAAFL